ncbi:MAG: hypothetical protein DMG81_07625, partial [Acidobacteria bacterium]
MVNGKKIETASLGGGSYRLTITVTNPQTQQKRFNTMAFQIVAENPSPSEVWQIEDDGLAEYVTSGQSDFDRGLTYQVKRNSQAAFAAFLEALRRNSGHEGARARVAD